MSKNKDFVRAANSLLFSRKELFFTMLAVFAAVLIIFPMLLRCWEKITLPDDFRLPYVNRDNYYFYSRCADIETQRSDYLLLGDSAIWGMYASNSGTLSAQLNRMQKKYRFGNLAIDGLHPVAMQTLMENFGDSIKNRKVLIYFNPLWVNSAKYDLSSTEKFTVNHPELLPQFGNIASYEASFDKKAGILLDRKCLFFSQLKHIRNCFYNNGDFKTHLVNTGTSNPFAPLRREITAEEKEHKGTSENYLTRRIPIQHWEWVSLSKSRQWQALVNTAEYLQKQGNQVTVMIGVINPGLLDKSTLSGLRQLRLDAAELLAQKKINSIMLPELDAKLYADASHPLESGYTEIAKALLKELAQ